MVTVCGDEPAVTTTLACAAPLAGSPAVLTTLMLMIPVPVPEAGVTEMYGWADAAVQAPLAEMATVCAGVVAVRVPPFLTTPMRSWVRSSDADVDARKLATIPRRSFCTRAPSALWALPMAAPLYVVSVVEKNGT